MKPKLTTVLGPTASGKTAYAIERARRQGDTAIVSADSRQLYAGMNIGTATPPEACCVQPAGQPWSAHEPHDIFVPDYAGGIPHYLLNIATPDKRITLGQWQQWAFEVIDMLIDRGIHPILTGGTMLYIDSIVYNYAVPNVAPNDTFRAELDQYADEQLWQQLMDADPEARQFIEPHQRRRIVRALEVINITNRPFSAQRTKQTPKYDAKLIGIFPGTVHRDVHASERGWQALRAHITERARKMLADGLLEETRHLRERYGADLPLLQTMNYKQAGSVLDGDLTEAQAGDEMVKVNVKYAKRQMSWWRGRAEIEWIQRD